MDEVTNLYRAPYPRRMTAATKLEPGRLGVTEWRRRLNAIIQDPASTTQEVLKATQMLLDISRIYKPKPSTVKAKQKEKRQQVADNGLGSLLEREFGTTQ